MGLTKPKIEDNQIVLFSLRNLDAQYYQDNISASSVTIPAD
jgi:hypothetical protein